MQSNKFPFPEFCLLRVKAFYSSGEIGAVAADPNSRLGNKEVSVRGYGNACPPLAKGDLFMARLSLRKGILTGKVLARVLRDENDGEKAYGIIYCRDGRYFLKSAEKADRSVYFLDNGIGAKNGDFVKIAVSDGRDYKMAKVIKTYGPFDLKKAIRPLVLEKYDIPERFSEKVWAETRNLPKFNPALRVDYTGVPLVTIDGDDAKDFDDAVYAEKTTSGFKLLVAIADVAFYVPNGSALDREAYQRGNSVYLPGMVIPMLPEVLSNDLCSLNPGRERAAIVCEMEIDKSGKLQNFAFRRGVIRSAARLTYREVQDALEGRYNDKTKPLFRRVIQPLLEAYGLLDRQRRKRGALELDVPETRIKVGKNGQVLAVERREVMTANKIIEEFMIAANVSAALALKESGLPVMYRIHDKPSEEKLRNVKPLLSNLGFFVPDRTLLQPAHFNAFIQENLKKGSGPGVYYHVLRLQSPACYSPFNIGHFGLALKDYVHFTSPIRRYSDLLIHRALIRALELPEGGGLDRREDFESFKETGVHLTDTEKRAVFAERDANEKYLAFYLQASIGMDFEVRVSGVANAGVFVQIESLGAEGLIPMSDLPFDHYVLDEARNELKGYRGLRFRLGDILYVRLIEACALNGNLVFRYLAFKEPNKQKQAKKNTKQKKTAAKKKANKVSKRDNAKGKKKS